jgi:transketolase
MADWVFNSLSEEYSLSSDHDDRWRSGGNLDEVLDEAHLSPDWVLKYVERFASERSERMSQLTNQLNQALGK